MDGGDCLLRERVVGDTGDAVGADGGLHCTVVSITREEDAHRAC